MGYFTWKEKGLTQDCESLEAMAYRFEESAKLMRKMAKEGFVLKRNNNQQLITHSNSNLFKEFMIFEETDLLLAIPIIPLITKINI